MVQGIALVTFPAASTILTDPSEYDLSSTQYGALFLYGLCETVNGNWAQLDMTSELGTSTTAAAIALAAFWAMVTVGRVGSPSCRSRSASGRRSSARSRRRWREA